MFWPQVWMGLMDLYYKKFPDRVSEPQVSSRHPPPHSFELTQGVDLAPRCQQPNLGHLPQDRGSATSLPYKISLKQTMTLEGQHPTLQMRKPRPGG